MRVRIYEIKGRPLKIGEVLRASGFKMTEDEMEKRIGLCECGCDSWILLPIWSKGVKDGGKRYMNCVDCGRSGHL